MERKLPKARGLLQVLLAHVVRVLPDMDAEPGAANADVHPKDLPVWRGFQRSGARYLVTFNVRDYPPVPTVSPPGPIVAEIRAALMRLATRPDENRARDG